ncbi:MAG: hypothetical protein AAF565_00460 [Pseudomonadota bacterium]
MAAERLEGSYRSPAAVGQGIERGIERGIKRVVLVDQTAPGGITATGALKESYFGDLPAERLLVVHGMTAPGTVTLQAGIHRRFRTTRIRFDADGPLSLIRAFRPDVVIYRPLPEAPVFHRIACSLVLEDAVPAILWFMDDWPSRLRAADPARADALERDLTRLCAKAAGCFAISERMAEVFRERYGGPPYRVAHNGIRRQDWDFTRLQRPEQDGLLIRYAGNLAPDMALASVTALAHAVADLVAEGRRVRLEIRSRYMRHKWCHERFRGLPGVSTEVARGSQADYRRWLAGADIGVVAYNFDPDTVRYTRFSFANKVPELMAAGAAVLAIGPIEIETIRYLVKHGVAAHVAEPAVLRDVLAGLIDDPVRRQALAHAARTHAERLDIDSQRRDMIGLLEGESAAGIAVPDAVRLMAGAPPGVATRLLQDLYLWLRISWMSNRVRAYRHRAMQWLAALSGNDAASERGSRGS